MINPRYSIGWKGAHFCALSETRVIFRGMDDIDIGMFREDYNRFIAEFNQSHEGSVFEFRSVETHADWHLPFGKVMDTTSFLNKTDLNLVSISMCFLLMTCQMIEIN